MAKKEDDSSLNFNTPDGKDKLAKEDSHQSYQEWDHDKFMAIVESLTSECGLGEEVFLALKGRRHTQPVIGDMNVRGCMLVPVNSSCELSS